MKKPFLIAGGVIIAILAIAGYIYYPFTKNGCDGLKRKVEKATNENQYCNLAADCSGYLDLGCHFSCGAYVNKNANQRRISGWAARYNRRCGACENKCLSSEPKPQAACLSHTCVASGDLAVVSTDKANYSKDESINLKLYKKTVDDLNFAFPIALCLRPTVMRLEQFSETTNEWLSSGVGLLFDNSHVVFYKKPEECSVYKVANCEPERANEFINQAVLKIAADKQYVLTAKLVESCDKWGKVVESGLSGRFRVGVYYEDNNRLGEQVYSNEFVIDEKLEIRN